MFTALVCTPCEVKNVINNFIFPFCGLHSKVWSKYKQRHATVTQTQDYRPLHLLFLTDLALWCHSMTWLCSPLPVGPEGFLTPSATGKAPLPPRLPPQGEEHMGLGWGWQPGGEGTGNRAGAMRSWRRGKVLRWGVLWDRAGGGSGCRQDWDYGDRWHEGIWHGWSQRPEGKTGPLASPRAWRPRSDCSRRQPLYTNSSLISYSCTNMKETSWGGGEVTVSKGMGCEGSGSKEMRSGVDREWEDRERRHREWGDPKWADREWGDGEGTAREGMVSEEIVNEGTVSVGTGR